MLKRNITYEDFNGVTVTETFYFNLSKTEIVDLEMEYEGGLEQALTRIIETKDQKTLISLFKHIVQLSYGIKSDDGKRFVKNNQICEEFTQTAAYDALFIELATNDVAAADFVTGIIPRDLVPQTDQDKPSAPPVYTGQTLPAPISASFPSI